MTGKTHRISTRVWRACPDLAIPLNLHENPVTIPYFCHRYPEYHFLSQSRIRGQILAILPYRNCQMPLIYPNPALYCGQIPDHQKPLPSLLSHSAVTRWNESVLSRMALWNCFGGRNSTQGSFSRTSRTNLRGRNQIFESKSKEKESRPRLKTRDNRTDP